MLSRTLDDEWIADNAEKVTRILPGGIHIVGTLHRYDLLDDLAFSLNILHKMICL